RGEDPRYLKRGRVPFSRPRSRKRHPTPFQISGFRFNLSLLARARRLSAPRHNAERPHLAIEVAAFHAEHFRGARDITLLVRERLENVIALELIARRGERH